MLKDFHYYTQTEVDGLFKKEMEISFPLDGIGRGATAPTITRLGNTIGWAFGIGDDGYMSFEVPLNWDGISNISVNLHMYVNEAYAFNNAETRWQATWSAVPEDGAEPVDGATHTGTLDSGDIDVPAVAKSLQEIPLGSIPLASLALHDTVFLLLSRIALVGGNDPAVPTPPIIVAAEYEWHTDSLGEDL